MIWCALPLALGTGLRRVAGGHLRGRSDRGCLFDVWGRSPPPGVAQQGPRGAAAGKTATEEARNAPGVRSQRFTDGDDAFRQGVFSGLRFRTVRPALCAKRCHPNPSIAPECAPRLLRVCEPLHTLGSLSFSLPASAQTAARFLASWPPHGQFQQARCIPAWLPRFLQSLGPGGVRRGLTYASLQRSSRWGPEGAGTERRLWEAELRLVPEGI